MRTASTSIKQQRLIIEQLRVTQKEKLKRNRSKMTISCRVSPSSVSSSSLSHAGSNDDSILRRNSSRRRAVDDDTKEENLMRSRNEERCLRAALTHPTVLEFLRSFMIAQGTDNTLDFYLDIIEIRHLTRERSHEGTFHSNCDTSYFCLRRSVSLCLVACIIHASLQFIIV